MDNQDHELAHTNFAETLVKPPVRIVRGPGNGKLFIGETEVTTMFPILRDSISVQRVGRSNVLTLSVVVGDVIMEGPTK